MLSYTEENYIKALLHLTLDGGDKEGAGTNELAAHLGVKPATATDMLKKLKEKKLIDYEKYGKISLTVEGRKKAMGVLRRHRLWETFLCEKLGFSWEEVHDIAEQLEHIQNEKLTEKLDKFLDYPEFDPHGDAIPTAEGEIKTIERMTLSQVEVGKVCRVVAVKDDSIQFLQYVIEVGIKINEYVRVVSKQPYDSLTCIEVNGVQSRVSEKFTDNIFVVYEE